MRLYELTAEYERLLSIAEECEEGADIHAALSSVEAAIEAKGAGIAAVLASLDGEAQACAAECERLSAKKRRLERNAEHLRQYVLSNMQAKGITKIKAATWTFSVVQNPERVVVDDIDSVPSDVLKTKTEVTVDKTAVLRRYRDHGECVPGTHVERGVRLAIK